MTRRAQLRAARAAERKAIERAILRTMRKLWIRGEETQLTPQTQAVLLGLEIARRGVRS